MWSTFIENYNGKSLILQNSWLSSDKVLLFSDASGALGFSAVLGTEWFAMGWDQVPDLSDRQIAIKELFPIVVALDLWGSALSNNFFIYVR